MKKLSLLFFALGTTIQGFSQITYEHTFTITQNGGISVYVSDIGNNNYKWVATDYHNDQFSLYNLDYSPYMLNIPIAVATDTGYIYQIGYITSTLFDCDSTNIEYAIMTVQPSDVRKFMIYRTDGTLLFSRDSVTVTYCYGCNVGSTVENGIENTPAGTKLVLENNHFQQFIYGLCGTLPEEVEGIDRSNAYVQVYPNPTSAMINFHVSSPNNYESFELSIFDAAFKQVKTTSITGANTQVNLDTESLSSGTYFYSLRNKNKIFQTGKFILSK